MISIFKKWLLQKKAIYVTKSDNERFFKYPEYFQKNLFGGKR